MLHPIPPFSAAPLACFRSLLPVYQPAPRLKPRRVCPMISDKTGSPEPSQLPHGVQKTIELLAGRCSCNVRCWFGSSHLRYFAQLQTSTALHQRSTIAVSILAGRQPTANRHCDNHRRQPSAAYCSRGTLSSSSSQPSLCRFISSLKAKRLSPLGRTKHPGLSTLIIRPPAKASRPSKQGSSLPRQLQQEQMLNGRP